MRHAVPDLPLCLGELKHRASFFTMDVCLCGAILNLKAYLFRSDSRYNDRVDSLLECATKYVVITVAQWNRNQIVRGLWLLARKKWKMDSCLCGAILNLTTFCSIWTLIEECSSIN
jgi:hypothetical protein